jgi:hypothetical protein
MIGGNSMNYRKYDQTGISPDSLGAAAGRPFPIIFFKVQPEIDRECDDLDRRRIRRLSPEMVNACVDRIHTNVCNRYPELAQYAQAYDGNSPNKVYNIKAEGIEVKIFGLFAGLIALLFLAEFARRRRRIRRHF